MRPRKLLKYAFKKFIDFKFRKRNPFFWGIKYFSIALAVELIKLAASSKIDGFYLYIEAKGGLFSFAVVWIIINIVFGGLTIVFSWLSIFIKVFFIVFFSFLEFKRSPDYRNVFKVNEKWFDFTFSKFYSEEIKSKYVNGLHQDLYLQEKELDHLTNFIKLKKASARNITELQSTINLWEINYRKVLNVVNDDSKSLPDYSPYSTFLNGLAATLNTIRIQLKSNLKSLKLKDYKTLREGESPTCFNIDSLSYIDFKPRTNEDFINWEDHEIETFYKVINDYNEVFVGLRFLNQSIKKITSKSIFIAGNAGVGKTHLAAHLFNTFKNEGEYPIIISAKKFSGEKTNLEAVFKELLDINHNNQFQEVLSKFNDFAVKKNRRIYIIIDGLNETTDKGIGFNKMWSLHIDSFKKQIEHFSHLFLLCTLRVSYIERIWSSSPKNLITINNFNHYELRSACDLYFDHFKIIVQNIDTANLDYFRVPLLLDLFCKMTNSSREHSILIDLNINSNIEIYEKYINRLKREVKEIKQLASIAIIDRGFELSAERFLQNNDASCTNEEFVLDFDSNDLVTIDESIGKRVLEGYLVYIKDFVEGNDEEIIMFTQQEVGGFLIAKKLITLFPATEDLIGSIVFQEKIIGNEEDKIHQLRFDILKFLVGFKPDMILLSDNEYVQEFAWWYVYNSDLNAVDSSIVEHLSNSGNITATFSEMISSSGSFWFNIQHPFNFNFIYNNLKKLSQWDYDCFWTLAIYAGASSNLSIIQAYNNQISIDQDLDYLLLKTRYVITTLSSNIRELRDISTAAIRDFGLLFPKELIDLTVDTREFKDTYIYQRMVQCCCAVALIKQNNQDFVEQHLPIFCQNLFDLQFSVETEKSVYSYIVADSIKVIIELGIYKNAFRLSSDELNRVKNYLFVPPSEWIEPTEEEQKEVDGRVESQPPEPLRMDFGIYTIPRLINREEIREKVAIANVWSRIRQLGFQELNLNEGFDQTDKSFHLGEDVYRFESKVDRLGKKYCWIGFFDYAGKLLLDGELDIGNNESTSVYEHNKRLSDVDIDITRPDESSTVNKQLFFEDLLKEKQEGNKTWSKIDKIDLAKDLFLQQFETENFTLLYGFIDQREDQSYDVRSFLMIESVFVSREHLDRLNNTEGKLYEWEDDIRISPSYLYNVYFGELYWADTVPKLKRELENFPTGEFQVEKRRLTRQDTGRIEYDGMNEGDEVDQNYSNKVNVETEPTLMDFRWESGSKTFKSYSEFVPASNIGRAFGLTPDCTNGNILDKDLKIASKSIEFENESFFSSNYNYLRTDLIKQYMETNNLALVYQVKQHSYDKTLQHNRKLKFFIYK